MPEVHLEGEETGNGWRFLVVVEEEDESTSRHEVTLSRADHQRLTNGGQVGPERLVRESFAYLLEREGKESILARFDLPVISRYFPEYESAILERLEAG